MPPWDGQVGQCVCCLIRSSPLWKTLGSQTRSFRAAGFTAQQTRQRLADKDRNALVHPGASTRRRPRDKSALSPKTPTNRTRSRFSESDAKRHDELAQRRRLKDLIADRLNLLASRTTQTTWRASLRLDQAAYEEHMADFSHIVLHGRSKSSRETGTTPGLLETLRKAYVDRDVDGLDTVLRQAFYAHVMDSKFTPSDVKRHQSLADLRHPIEWFPATRAKHRKIHLHVGPTNSGKTYHALKRLEAAESGVYAGPLRLLAHEVYSRLNAKGRPCNLITGEERRIVNGQVASMNSCTVEMVPLNTDLDVAVIDEIQMIGSEDRGWAWTQALLGVKAKEVHLCGEERVVPLIRKLVAMTGDSLEMHHYKRLSPLKTMSTSLNGDLKELRKGDCVVVFSRFGIHAMKKQIESATGMRCAIVYGSLPPETRAHQARLFNDPDNEYDVLVASDAIGMGLNLSIKRVIFESVQKHNGHMLRRLSVPEIKQISGRAGRYRTAQHDVEVVQTEPLVGTEEVGRALPALTPLTPLPAVKNLGLVTTLDRSDHGVLLHAMESEAEPIPSAGILPPFEIMRQFAAYFDEDTPFSYIMLRLHDLSKLDPLFHLCSIRDLLNIADLIQPVDGISTIDRIRFCAAPISLGDSSLKKMALAMAKCIARQTGGGLLDIGEFRLELLEQSLTLNKGYLQQLESLHKGVALYLWLSYRFAGVFHTRALAFHVKHLVEQKIDGALAEFQFGLSSRAFIRRKREKSLLDNLKRQMVANSATVPIELIPG